MGRKRLYTDEERRARKRDANREWKRKRSVALYGTLEERAANEMQRIQDVVKERCVGFEYVGNYTGSDGNADIRCTVCGTVITRSWISIRHGKVCCKACKEKEAEQRHQKELADKKRNAVKEAFIKQSRIKQKQASLQECQECGELFISFSARSKFCSASCRIKNHNRVGKDRRLDLMDKSGADMSIDWRPLYKKENGICYLCGEPVDIHDYVWVDGTFIAGNYYPSVDHVVALHDGGTHTWDNVRLAHRRCNSIKH